MKWISKRPIYDDSRYIKKFLLFPIKVKREVCWLETAYIFQVWNHGWKNKFFITEEYYNDFDQKRKDK